ncbi:hypothetical protein MHH96_21795 [Niallia sp. FSL K6-0212]|uniref:hypothetical protein n=1 Tax=Niallia sp. FSL K6-0212 TaxID=2921423 RepID=UPI0030F61F17
MNGNKGKLIKSIDNIMKDDTSLKLFLKSIYSLKPSLKRILWLTILFIIIYNFYSLFLVKNIDGITSTIEIINNVYIIIIPIFAIIITGYAIFQALTNGRTLMALMRANENDRSKFQEYNYFFFSISILYLTIIIINFLLSIILGNLPEGWYFVYFNKELNNKLFSVFVSIYIVFIVNALIEMKSFIYNLYQLFSSHAIASAIEQLKKNDE